MWVSRTQLRRYISVNVWIILTKLSMKLPKRSPFSYNALFYNLTYFYWVTWPQSLPIWWSYRNLAEFSSIWVYMAYNDSASVEKVSFILFSVWPTDLLSDVTCGKWPVSWKLSQIRCKLLLMMYTKLYIARSCIISEPCISQPVHDYPMVPVNDV